MNITIVPHIVPENMQYIFKDADHFLSQEDLNLLNEKVDRAKKLEKCNGADYPGLTQSAVYWLYYAYNHKELINKAAFYKILDDLYNVRQPRKWKWY